MSVYKAVKRAAFVINQTRFPFSQILHFKMAPALRAIALALRAASSTCPSSPTCPQDDQCSLTSNGATLQVSCATDFYGGDLQLAQVSTINSVVSCLEINAHRFSDIKLGKLHSCMLHDHRMQRCKLRGWQLLPQKHPQCGSAQVCHPYFVIDFQLTQSLVPMSSE